MDISSGLKHFAACFVLIQLVPLSYGRTLDRNDLNEILDEHGTNELGPDDFEEAHIQNITIPIIDATHPDPLEGEFYHKENETMRETLPGTVWPNGKVYYYIDSVFNNAQRAAIAKGIQEIEEKSCVRFEAATSATKNYIYITDDRFCYSTHIGKRVQQGRQDISLGRQGCVYHGIIVHEFMHALGFHHEQNRADRDQYVTINWNNIVPSARSQFTREPDSESHGSSYDYYSVMHYAKWDFSSNGRQTITPKRQVSESGCNSIGQRCGMSTEDAKQMNALYKCTGIGGPTCQDTRPTQWCQYYNWACTSSRYPWFRRDCKKTCNNCDGETNCTNKYGDKYCQTYTWACTDSRYPWYKEGCQKTCEIC